MVVLEKLLEFWTGYNVVVALAPCRAVIDVIDHDRLQFRVVVTEVDDDFGYAGFQVPDRVCVEVVPISWMDRRIGDQYRIQEDILVGEN